MKILFVCLGNICRSPMAEYVFRRFAEAAGAEIFCDSAGTSDEEAGSDVYPAARRKLLSEGIPCPPRRARQVERADYAAFDRIYCMEARHAKSLLRLFGGDPQGKIRLMTEETARPRDVADPWYTGDFDAAFRDICEGARAILRSLTKN